MLEGARSLDDTLRQEMLALLAESTAAPDSSVNSVGDASRDGQNVASDETGSNRLRRLEKENADLVERLQASQSALSEVRATHRQHATDSQDVERLRAQIEQGVQLMRRLRERLVDSEERATSQGLQLERANVHARRASEAFEATRVELTARIDELTQTNRRLESQIAEVDAAMQRLGREKHLIEQKYLQLDAQVRAGTAD